MTGIIFSIIAGAAMSVQGVMNTRLGEQTGPLHAGAFVQATAAALALALLLFEREGSFAKLGGAPWYCWVGGALGVLITLAVMQGMGRLSPAVAVSVILISQLVTAAGIDALGLMGTEKTPLGWGKLIGLALMLAGVVVFKR